MRQQDIIISDRVIGPDSRSFVIVDAGFSHDGSLSRAEALIDAAARCGADAIKFHSFRPERLTVPFFNCGLPVERGRKPACETMRRSSLNWGDLEKLKSYADRRELLFLSTPFDEETVDFLDGLGVPAFKIASSDITHMPLLRHAASKGKPILLSTGMSYLHEVAEAVWNLRAAGAKEILLMHCVSAFPVPAASMNLRSIQTLRDYFELPVGFSDHSAGILLAPVAAALGAVIIEKHFTLGKSSGGPEEEWCADPGELQSLIQHLREVEASLGDGRKRPCDMETVGRWAGRRSIVSSVDISAFEPIAPWMLVFKRPGGGIEPRDWRKVVGMKARRSLCKDTILQWEDLIPAAASEIVQERIDLEPGISGAPHNRSEGNHPA